MKKLSARQEEILGFIRKHIEEEGISPTLDEIAAAFSFSPAAAHYAIDALARKGALEKDEGRSRGIRLKDEERDERENMKIPLFSSEPSPADVREGYTDKACYVPRRIARSGAYAFIVRSESMRDAGIIPGDIAIMTDDISSLKDGDIVLADQGDESGQIELRRYRRLPGYVLLIPDNAIMGIRKSNSAKVYGILAAIRRDYGLPASRT